MIDFYDDQTEAMISLKDFYGDPQHLVDKCLVIYSEEIYQYLLNHFSCHQIAAVSGCNGLTPVYQLTYQDCELAFYLSHLGSAIASQLLYEVSWLTGARQFVMFGSCGSLDQEKTNGHFIIPTESYRGEGCSYYFAPASDYITIKNSDRLAQIFKEKHIPYVQGRVWTTDSMLRETHGLVQKRREEGCLAVEMELAGVQAVCDFYGLELFDFLEAGDVLSTDAYDIADLNNANHHLGKLFIALEIALQI